MRALTYVVSAMVTGLCLAGVIGCTSMLGKPTDELLANPSLHILLNDEASVPEGGTFDFDTKLFKVNYSEEIDLAAIDARVIASLEAELRRKGFKRSAESPDLLVSYAVALDAPVSGADFNEAYADEFPIVIPEAEPNQELNYHQGALIVDFIDSTSRKLLWRGAIMVGVTMDVSDREKDRRVRHGVRILLQHFPKPIVASSGVGGPGVEE